MKTVDDFFRATEEEQQVVLASRHGRRRAAASPFDEIARVGKDGQPYWSARDLASVLGYVQWRNFVEAIRKARQQVEAHVNAGQDHFADVSKMVTVGSGAARPVPDVHLTRFAAYFVALNADQSKPEVRAAVNYYFAGRTIQAEQMIQAGADDNALTAENAKRVADLELAVQGLPEVIGDAIAKALGSTEVTRGAPDAPRARAVPRRRGLPSLASMEQARYGTWGTKFKNALVRDGYLTRTQTGARSDGQPLYSYSEGTRPAMFRFRNRPSGPYTRSGRCVYVTEAGQRFLAEEYGWEMP